MSSVVVVDVECFTNGIVKEIGMFRNGFCIGISFSPPFPISYLKSWNRKQCNWLTKKKHKIDWNSGNIPYSYLPFVMDLFCEIRECEMINYSKSPWNLFMSKIDDFRNKNSNKFFYEKKFEFFAKGMETCSLLETIFRRRFYDLNVISCPSVETILKQLGHETFFVGKCSSFPREHSKMIKHCAQRKSQLYGMWFQQKFE